MTDSFIASHLFHWSSYTLVGPSTRRQNWNWTRSYALLRKSGRSIWQASPPCSTAITSWLASRWEKTLRLNGARQGPIILVRANFKMELNSVSCILKEHRVYCTFVFAIYHFHFFVFTKSKNFVHFGNTVSPWFSLYTCNNRQPVTAQICFWKGKLLANS